MSSDVNSNEVNSAKYPGYGSYTECVTRALFAGLSAFTIVFSGTFFGQRFIHRSRPYSIKSTVLISTSAAVLVSYYVASRRTRACATAWKTPHGN